MLCGCIVIFLEGCKGIRWNTNIVGEFSLFDFLACHFNFGIFKFQFLDKDNKD